MKKLVIIILALTITLVAGRTWLAKSARAQSVEAADNDLTTTERELRNAVNATTIKATTLEHRLSGADRNTSLPKDVEEFLTTTERLEHLRQELRQDIDHLAAARNRTFVALDRERSLITDPIVRHAMTGLRTQAKQQTAERLTSARDALDLLTRVLVQGSDVVHAARCVELAEELNTHGDALDERVRRVTEEANAYTTMTADLLGRLTTSATEITPK